MKKPIEIQTDMSIIEDLVGLKGKNIQKSYYPQLLAIIDELDREKQKYLSIFNNAVNGILRIRPNGEFFDFNPAMALILGIPEDDKRGKNLLRDYIKDRDDFHKIITGCRESSQVINDELNLRKSDGTNIIVFLNAHLINIDGEEIIELFVLDMTEKIQAEERLIQGQKMEAVGKLAGGIAHDFNNLLTSIMGATDMLMNGPHSEDELREYGDIILTSSEMAVELTSKLLAFSRQESVKKTELSLGEILDLGIAILERTLNSQIILKKEIHTQNDIIFGNKAELQNCLINLAVNSSHAMPKGGNLTITLDNRHLSKEDARRLDPDIKQGDYILLSIMDTGTGIKPSDLPHIFEPFFTTKEKGKGTGLGLSTVYGIIKEHKGFIQAESEWGKGTVFTIYLPLL